MQYLSGIGPGHFIRVFGVDSFVLWAKSSLPLLGSWLKNFKFENNGGMPYLASCTPSKWSILSGEAVGFVDVHRLRDLP